MKDVTDEQAMEIALCLEPLAIVRGPVMPYLSSLEAALATAGDRLSPRTASRAFAKSRDMLSRSSFGSCCVSPSALR